MANDRDRSSLRDFNPHADENGQFMGQDSPLDVAHPAELQKQLNENPDGQAETARLASSLPRRDALEGGSIATSDATAAETPAENIRRISDPSLPKTQGSAGDAIDRATSGLGREP
jgi:hypothetical protein